MTAGEVLERCQLEGITITPTPQGTLKVRGSRLPAELVEAVRVLKPELLRLLQAEPDLAIYSRPVPPTEGPVRIVTVAGAGVTGGPAYQLVATGDGQSPGVGLFASETWARAWCAEHDLTVVEGAGTR